MNANFWKRKKANPMSHPFVCLYPRYARLCGMTSYRSARYRAGQCVHSWFLLFIIRKIRIIRGSYFFPAGQGIVLNSFVKLVSDSSTAMRSRLEAPTKPTASEFSFT